MKFIILSLFTVLASLTSPANAGTILNCKGGAGGPGAAVAELVIEESVGPSVRIFLKLKNSALPLGSTSTLEGIFQEANQTIYAEGTLDGHLATIHLVKTGQGRLNLSIYNEHNRHVEFGYGAHFGCR